jgi:hypothetical protein
MITYIDKIWASPLGPGKLEGKKINGAEVGWYLYEPPKDQWNNPNYQWKYVDYFRQLPNGKWSLFIDDERFPAEKQKSIIIARTSNQAISLIRQFKSFPNFISFDHDLGGEDTSMVFLKRMTNILFDELPYVCVSKDFKYSIHSQNPIGCKNIKGYMAQFIEQFVKPRKV